MADEPKQPRSISEISHLFLSSVRDKQTGSASRPVRIPPGAPRPAASASGEQESAPHRSSSVDLTPEEYAQVFGETAEQEGGDDRDDAGEVRIPTVTAVIAQHLNGRAQQRVTEYARHLAANGERVGVLEVDAGEVRLARYERSIEPNQGDPEPAAISDQFDARFLTEALDEMSWDVDRWLLVLPNLRTLEAKALLKDVDHWALLSTCDHDGVVSCYRTLKGLANVHRPRMTLALMETTSEAQAAKVHKKLQSVCLQFLGIELAGEPAVRPTRAVAEHVIAHCRTTRDKAQLSDGAQWLVISHFLARAKVDSLEGKSDVRNAKLETSTTDEGPMIETEIPAALTETVIPMRPAAGASAPAAVHYPQAAAAAAAAAADAMPEVIDLPSDAADDAAVLAAIMSGGKADLIECPVRAPMCPAARLAVTRDRGLVILAVASKGLAELRAIVHAYRWTVENRALIGMAVPQLAIDAHRHPRLRLLVDHADMTAETLAPMMESATVSVQAYRKLRWGNKTGLLLDAA